MDKEVKMLALVCAGCGIEFERPSHKIGTKIGMGQRDFYHSRECAMDTARRKRQGRIIPRVSISR